MNLGGEFGAPSPVRVVLPALAGRYGLEWLVEAGDRVEQGQVLAWLAVADHCALLPLNAPVSGVLTSRWSDLLSSGPPRAVVAAIDPLASTKVDAACLAAQRHALAQERAAVIERLDTIAARTSHPTAFALLEPERRRLSTWLAQCDRLLSDEPSP